MKLTFNEINRINKYEKTVKTNAKYQHLRQILNASIFQTKKKIKVNKYFCVNKNQKMFI